MKRYFSTALFAVTALFASASYSATVLTDGSGQLISATGVNVGGAFYDVNFLDGGCSALFDGCDDPSNFVFSNAVAAQNASQALLDQVIVGTSFNADPALIQGCDLGDLCRIFTPFLIDPEGVYGSNTVETQAAQVFPLFSDVTGYTRHRVFDLGVTDTFAVWSSTTSTVPLPAGVWLFGSAIAGLVGLRFKRI